MDWLTDPPEARLLSAVLDQSPERTLTADAFWARLRPHLPRFGITRLADITGLDHVGLPVAQAVRPMARSNAVTQGKAETLVAAALGATLECLEMAAGEAPERFVAALAPSDPAPWLPLAPGAVWPDVTTDWIAAWDVTRDLPAAIPRDLISTDFSQGAVAEAAPILRHSIGLGAGATLAEALMHGLFEAIEGDARCRAEASGRMPRIAAPGPDFAARCADLAARGLRVALHDMAPNAPLACVMASVMEAPGPSALPLPATGFAARPDPAAAAEAALNEALQARLAVISGAREDITQRFYTHGVPADVLADEWDRHGPVDLPTPPPRPARRWSIRDLAATCAPVFAVPLVWDPALPLAITRIVAPGLIADPLRLEVPS